MNRPTEMPSRPWRALFADDDPRAALCEGLVQSVTENADISGLFFAGSFARGDHDAFSDLDFVAVATQPLPPWSRALGALTPLILVRAPAETWGLTNLITSDWTRIDILTVRPNEFVDLSQRSTFRALLDRGGLSHAAGRAANSIQVDTKDVERSAEEAVRVLGLTPVVIGRGELLLAVSGLGLVRESLIRILRAAGPDLGQRGALRLNPGLAAEDLALLISLNPPRADEASIRETTLAYVQVFRTRAVEVAREVGADWPDRFAEVTWARLEKFYGVSA